MARRIDASSSDGSRRQARSGDRWSHQSTEALYIRAEEVQVSIETLIVLEATHGQTLGLYHVDGQYRELSGGQAEALRVVHQLSVQKV